jgi:hypothetical protein
LGGNGAPSETLRRNPGGADEGRQGSCLSVPPSLTRDPAARRRARRRVHEVPSSRSQVRRPRRRSDRSLLLHGSTSSMKYLVPEASRYGFVEGSCVHGASTQMKTREWIVARITAMTEKVVDAKVGPSSHFLVVSAAGSLVGASPPPARALLAAPRFHLQHEILGTGGERVDRRTHHSDDRKGGRCKGRPLVTLSRRECPVLTKW